MWKAFQWCSGKHLCSFMFIYAYWICVPLERNNFLASWRCVLLRLENDNKKKKSSSSQNHLSPAALKDVVLRCCATWGIDQSTFDLFCSVLEYHTQAHLKTCSRAQFIHARSAGCVEARHTWRGPKKEVGAVFPRRPLRYTLDIEIKKPAGCSLLVSPKKNKEA